MSTKLHTLISGVGYGNESGPMHQRIYDEIVKEVAEGMMAVAWWHGVTDQWTHRPIGNRIPEVSNPYRKTGEQSNG